MSVINQTNWTPYTPEGLTSIQFRAANGDIVTITGLDQFIDADCQAAIDLLGLSEETQSQHEVTNLDVQNESFFRDLNPDFES